MLSKLEIPGPTSSIIQIRDLSKVTRSRLMAKTKSGHSDSGVTVLPDLDQ